MNRAEWNTLASTDEERARLARQAARARPATEHELVPAIGSWIARAFAVTGVQPLLGLRLRGAYRAAGLEPQDPVEAISIVYVGRESAEMTAGLVRSMLPVLVEHGIATAEEVDIDTLADRIVAAAGDEELVGAVGPLVAAWARKP